MEVIDTSFLKGYSVNQGWAIIKRLIDILFSLVLLVILIPVIIIMAAILTIETPGNPFFKQTRIGKNGKLFTMYKMRTLYVHHFGEIQEQEEPHAYRITPIGKYLRRIKIDELPQLLNILLGDMSFIGPRPYTLLDFDQSLRITRVFVKPGLTGIAQISGNAKLGKPNIAWMDFWYIKHYSFMVDAKILIHTLPAIIKGESGVYDPFNLHAELPFELNHDISN